MITIQFTTVLQILKFKSFIEKYFICKNTKFSGEVNAFAFTQSTGS